MNYFVYILKSLAHDRFYTGHSSDYQKRLSEHNRGKVRSTKAYSPWIIVHLEEFGSKSEAFQREMQIKSYKHGEAFNKLLNYKF